MYYIVKITLVYQIIIIKIRHIYKIRVVFSSFRLSIKKNTYISKENYG